MSRLLALVTLLIATPALGQSVLLQTFAPPEPVEDGNYGRAADFSGDFVLIGAPGDEETAGGAYVYLRAPGTDVWDLEADLEPSSLIATSGVDPHFGASVALSGRNALVGALGESEVEPVSGAAYIFRRDEETFDWIDFAKLKAPTPATGDAFGAAVALSGGTAAVGAYGDDGGGDVGDNPGAVYMYTEDIESGAWSFAQRLVSNDPRPGERFGYAVAVSADLLVVGTYDIAAPGAAYVFERDDADSPWVQVQRLVADVADPTDLFGAAVATDGSTILVGAPFAGATDEGAAFTFERTGAGDTPWVLTQRLISNAPQAKAYFGASVSVEDDRVAVGAPRDDAGIGVGGVYLFEKIEGGPWNPTSRLGSANPDAASFGAAVALSSSLTLVGAPGTGDASEGAAFVFSLLPTAAEGSVAPGAIGLEAPFPNPARTATAITYTLGAPAATSLAAYDMLGREVAVLNDGVQPAGRHTVRWTTADLPPGIYVVRLAAGEQTATRKLVVLR